MSTSLAAAFAAALALNATAVEPPVTAATAAVYDPCAAAPLVKTAQKTQIHRKTLHHAPHHRPAPIVRPHKAVKLHRTKTPRPRRHAVRLVRAHETCAAGGGGAVGAFDLSNLIGAPVIRALQANTPTGVDAAAQAPPSAPPELTDQPDFAPAPDFDDDAPFILGPGGLGGGGGSGGGGGGGGGGTAPGGGGGGIAPPAPPTGSGVSPSGPDSPPVAPGGPSTSPITPPAGPPVSAVPEPSTWAFLLAGFAMLGAALRRRPARA